MFKEGFRKIFSRLRPQKKEEAVPQYAFTSQMNAKTLSKDAMGIISSLSGIGPRLSLSKEERMCGNRVLAALEENGIEGEAEEFRAENRTQLLWGKIVGYCMPLIPLLVLIGQPLFALLVTAALSCVFWFDGINEKGLFARFLKKETGLNVVGEIPAEEEEKTRIIFTSHLDSARLFRKDDAHSGIYMSAAALVSGLILSLFMTLYELIRGELFSFNFNIWVNIFITIPLFVLSVFSFRVSKLYSGEVSPGSGDNLSGVSVCLVLSKYFMKRRLKNTAVEFAFFSSEETGKAGSRNFYAKREKDGATVINVDGLYSQDDLSVLMSDGNGMVKLDESLALSIAELSSKLGYRMKTGKLSFLSGSTDAMNASLSGYSATTITSMIPGSANPGHTHDDTVEHIDQTVLESVIAVLMKYAEDTDKKFAPGEEKKEESGFLSSDIKYLITKE